MTALVLDGCAVVTMDAGRAEHASGHVVVDGQRITAVGPGPAPDVQPGPAASTRAAAWPPPA